MKKSIFLIILTITLSSCLTVLKVAYGVRNPKPHTTEFILEKANKYGLNQFDHYQLTSSGFVEYFTNLKQYKLANRTNQLFIFNANGQLLLPLDSISCSNQIGQQIQDYQTNSYVVDTVFFQSIFGDTVSQIGDAHNRFNLEKDFTIVMTWASYAGKLNKMNTKEWADSLAEAIDIETVQPIFLNLDIQKDWGFDNFKVNKRIN